MKIKISKALLTGMKASTYNLSIKKNYIWFCYWINTKLKKKTVNKHRALKIAFNSFIHHFIY